MSYLHVSCPYDSHGILLTSASIIYLSESGNLQSNFAERRDFVDVSRDWEGLSFASFPPLVIPIRIKGRHPCCTDEKDFFI